MPRSTPVLVLAAWCVLSTGRATAQQPNEKGQTALAARAVLKQYCYTCHHGAGSEAGDFDVLDAKTMTAPREGERPFVVGGKAAESYLFERVSKGSMPPKATKERPTDAEKEVLKKWIDAGAPGFPTQERKAIDLRATLYAVRDHLRAARAEDRPFLQFFTLANLHNNPALQTTDLRTTRAALSKALNSMHWKARVVVPKAVKDSADTLLVIDIRDLDWDKKGKWREVQKAHPYALRYGTVADDDLAQADGEIAKLAGLQDGDPLPLTRADWFVSTATRPPLYHTLLEIPDSAPALEKRLEVDVIDNFNRDRLARAGFGASGVSRQNRLLERHEGAFGAFWKSYDFLAKQQRANLNQFPLGPVFKDHPYGDQAFEHDGGEMIFSLPNKMQGYMLVNGKDQRIDAGPIAVVGDNNKTSGTFEIVNGLSCMFCHKHGMIKFTDTVRAGNAVFGAAKQKVSRLYPAKKDMDDKVKEDTDAFMGALDKAVGPFLKVEEDKDKTIEQLTEHAEVVGAVAVFYRVSDLDLASAAYELDLAPLELKGIIAGNKKLQGLGLAVLTAPNGRLKREDWEKAKTRSVYQIVAQEIGKGTPVVIGK